MQLKGESLMLVTLVHEQKDFLQLF